MPFHEFGVFRYNGVMATAPLPKRCSDCAPGTAALSDADADHYLLALPGWQRVGKEITKTFSFANYHDTIAFVNATAWISHRENHHPDLEVGYNRCVIRYSTHAANGLTPNDFICATKIESLLTL